MASLIASAPWKYDVFLSSSSQDAGNFSYLLHKALKDEGILTLRDSQEVEGAESTASLEVGIRLEGRPSYYLAGLPPLGSWNNLCRFLKQTGIQVVSSSQAFTLSTPQMSENKKELLEQASPSMNKNKTRTRLNGSNSAYNDIVQSLKRCILRKETENIIEQSVDEVSTNTSVEEKIIEQPVDEVSRNTSVKDKIITVNHEEQKATVDATSSAEWNFLLFTLILVILSAGFDQASSPSKPHYALIAMLLAAAAVFTCIWELIQRKSLVLKSWKKLHCISYPHLSDTFFESHLDTYGLVSSIYQCVFSTVQYIYFFYNANSPIRLCALPALYLMCLAGSRLWKKYHKSKPLPV
uniref:uncharacterized protein LOC101301450 n=1 Tax=Fragaria vesca subsp. vesca TaxID=101020 RepID=UPI0005C9AA65|nr:PREDICTED: uncharacterized protein LOC101301450 [Fragaria vesca subsp. vesca]